MPKAILRDWESFARRLKRRGGVLLGLDFDGTLSPIVWHPALARLGARTREILRQFANHPKCPTAVISGRGLSDLRKRVGLRGLVYAGNHGIEIEGPNFAYLHPKAAAAARKIKVMEHGMSSQVRAFRGANLENKGFSLSLHYRNARPKDVPELERIVRQAVAGPKREWEVLRGKKVIEVRPRLGWEKGDALRLLIKRKRRKFPIFIGDDTVDEHAFLAAQSYGGVGIRVGRADRSEATHYIDRQSKVPEFLNRLLTLLS
ncbi:MAG: trehalose-phosphatase [Elusimicrobiota bacterium]